MGCPLRITQHKIYPLRIFLSEPIRTSFGIMTHRQACLLELITDEGVSGWGESWINYPHWGLVERVATLEAMVEQVVGQSFVRPQSITQGLWHSFSTIARQWGAPGPIAQAVSAIDLALWDIYGKIHGVSIRELLGTRERRIAVYASGIGPGQIDRMLEHAQRLDMKGAKIKVGFGFDDDLNNIKLARSIWGDQHLMLDANQAWDVPEAQAILPVLAEYQPDWIEEPLAADNWEGLTELSKQDLVAVALGENLYGKDFNRVLNEPAVHYIQPDIAKTGGLTRALEIWEMAKTSETSQVVLPHVFGTALSVVIGAHFSVAAKSPWLELDLNPNPFREELLTNPLMVKQGFMEIPSGPGWGVDIDREFLEYCQA